VKRTPRLPRYPNKLLVIGMTALVAGGVLLMVNLGSLAVPASLWPLAPLAAGLVFLYLAYVRGRSSRYILPGMLLTLGGLFFLLVETVLGWDSVARFWPAFMLITGLSMLTGACAWSRRRGRRSSCPAYSLPRSGCCCSPSACGVRRAASPRSWAGGGRSRSS